MQESKWRAHSAVNQRAREKGPSSVDCTKDWGRQPRGHKERCQGLSREGYHLADLKDGCVDGENGS